MKVIHVVPRISDEASGPSYAVPALCRSLAEQGGEIELQVLAPAPVLKGAAFKLRTYPPWPVLSRLGISPAMKRGLKQDAAGADIMHNHSLWMMPNLYPAWAVRGTRCRLVTTPHGTLAGPAIRRSRFFKWIMWRTWQAQAVRDSVCFHATTAAEAEDIRRAGFGQPIAVIPFGVDIPDQVPAPATDSRLRRLLFFGRIHPIKGIDYLLRAWRRVQDQAPDWELQIAGPDNNGWLKQMQDLARSLQVERCNFQGPAYGAAKSEVYRQADLFVLPSHTENFGMTVAEALAHGVPAIVSQGAPWSGLVEHDCGWWVPLEEGNLADCLREALALPPEELRASGNRGRVWMERDFSWTRIGRMMHETYLWLLGGGACPAWVNTQD
jgi:glycosyltransferase involved in cell wall biosynthesis